MNFWKRYQKRILLGFKWIIFFLAFYYLYKAVFVSQDFDDFIKSLKEVDGLGYLLLAGTCFLMIMNWGIEALKWQTLLKHIQTIGFPTSFKAIFSGVTVSSIMPNRIAEYLGRIFYIRPQKRIKAIIATLVGSFAQTLITVICGSLAFLFYFRLIQPGSFYLFYILMALTLGLNLILLFIYFNVGSVNYLIPEKPYLTKLKQYINVLAYFHSKGLGVILGYAGLRYLVFLIQFLLLFKVFNVSLAWEEALISIPLNFFTQAIIPSIALTELGVRGATAVHFIGYFADNKPGILMGTYALWFINLLIPAFFGAIFLVIQRNGENH